MHWTRITPRGDRMCASQGCGQLAKWHGQAGEVGSDYCSTCRDAIDDIDLRAAAAAVVAFDWSDNDADAVAAIDRLRRVVQR